MRVLLVNRFFGNYHVPTGRMLGDLSAELIRKGHQITVLTSFCASADKAIEGLQLDHVKIKILWDGGRWGRSASWVLFWTQAMVQIPLMKWDCCIVLTDPPFVVVAAYFAKILYDKRKIYWWPMDLYPEALVADKLIPKGGTVERILRFVNNVGIKALDGVISFGARQEERLRTYTGWKDDPSFSLVVSPWDNRPLGCCTSRAENKAIKRFGWQDKTVVLYAGNLGRAHSYKEIIEAARILQEKGEKKWVFAFFCRGAKRAALKKEGETLSNVLVCDYMQPVETVDMLHAADIHLITMSESWKGIVVPSKLYGVLKTSAPVLFIGPEDSETAEEIKALDAGISLVNNCGGRAVADALRKLAKRRVFAKNLESSGPRKIAEFIMAR
ncbi:MAG: hypothetical protein D4S01_08235 [Dehalococcoidia bacterium]|nr:MAG: hypothetical protein D4S01_08235 [Dehalococcoidia bacterium]